MLLFSFKNLIFLLNYVIIYIMKRKGKMIYGIKES